MTTDAGEAAPWQTWICEVCSFVYEEELGCPDHGIPAGTRWADVPADWCCPECGVTKADFILFDE